MPVPVEVEMNKPVHAVYKPALVQPCAGETEPVHVPKLYSLIVRVLVLSHNHVYVHTCSACVLVVQV